MKNIVKVLNAKVAKLSKVLYAKIFICKSITKLYSR